ncbi:MAG TPA: TonB-dependent receptor, partial [Gemmatimonadales bacterium]
GIAANQPGGAFNLAHLSTEDVERIEILRGPASVLYGSDAVSGVIQIVTRRGKGRPRLDLSARVGSFGTADLGAQAAGSSGPASWSAGVTRFTSDGIYPYNNRYRSQTASARLGLTPDERTDLGLAARWGDHRAHFPTDFAGVPSDTNQFSTERGLSLSLDAGRRLGRVVELRVLAGLFDSEQGFEDRSDTPADTTGFGFEGFRTGEVRRTLLDLRALLRPTERLTLSAGAERVDERERLSNLTRSNFGDGGFDDETEFERDRGNTALYAQALGALGTRVDVQGGLRYEDNQVFGDFTTWRLGLVLRPASALRLHGAGGSAFRQPTFAEQFANTPFEVGNPDLTPERATSWEAGAELALAERRVMVTATWFAQRFRGLIQYQAAASGLPNYFNVARARADGVELGAHFALSRSLSLNGRYTWLETEVQDDGGQGNTTYTEGEPLLRRPAHTAGIGLSWHPGTSGSYALQLQRTGDRVDVDFREFPAERVTLEGYTLLDASADVPLAALFGGRASWARSLGLTLVGQNLLDANYQSVVGFRGRGRTLLLGARARF